VSVLGVERREGGLGDPIAPTELGTLLLVLLVDLRWRLSVLLSTALDRDKFLRGENHGNWLKVAKGDRRGILALCA
jgi:hypothetical protein